MSDSSLRAVGAKCSAAMHEMSWRLSSSGNGEVQPAGAQARLDVQDGDAQVERGERRGHRAARVAVDEDGGGEAAVQDVVDGVRAAIQREAEALDHEVLEALHDRGHALVQAAAGAGPQRRVDLDAGQAEDLLDELVVLPGRDDEWMQVLALAEREDDRDELDRLRASADDDGHDAARLGAAPDRLGHAPRRVIALGGVIDVRRDGGRDAVRLALVEQAVVMLVAVAGKQGGQGMLGHRPRWSVRPRRD